MRYLDSGQREPSKALGTWLQQVMSGDVAEVRWQSGFFAADSLGIIQSALRTMAGNDHPVHALIGSNDQCTVRTDVERLVGDSGDFLLSKALARFWFWEGRKECEYRAVRIKQGVYLDFFHLTRAAFAATRLRCSLVMVLSRRLPPI